MAASSKKPKIFVLGVTGQSGSLIAELLRKQKDISLRVSSRKKEQLPILKEKFEEAVYLDLDDPRTFASALVGVERLFLVTGYSVSMLVQSKAIVDAAKKAGVKHIVHLGLFSLDPDCYDSHFAWHQMIEIYIKASDIPYTFLHPNCFLQNFTGFYGMAKNGTVTFYANDKRVGWVALEDVAEAAAKVLLEGPAKHHGKEYWFSTESLNIYEIATAFTEGTGKRFTAAAKTPDDFLKDMDSDRKMLDPYFIGVEQCLVQTTDGRMSYISQVKDDLPLLIGRKGITAKEWASRHKEELIHR